MPESQTTPATRAAGPKPFPWRCPKCRKKVVWREAIPYRVKIKHDNQLHSIEIPQLLIPRCKECGELLFDNEADEQICQALRAHLGLLSPEQIRCNRETLGLTQQELGRQLRLVAEELSSWEMGTRIQSCALDI